MEIKRAIAVKMIILRFKTRLIHGRPYLPQASIDDGEKDKIAAIHPDFERGLASVPDGIRWRAPPSIGRAECALSQSGSTRHGPTCLAIMS